MLLPEHRPEPWRRVRVSFPQPLAASAGMNATPAPPETKPAEVQPGAGGRIRGEEPRAPQHHRGGGVRVWTPPQGFLPGQAHPREEHPLEEGYQKPCSSINGSNIKGLLAGGWEHLEPLTPEKRSVSGMPGLGDAPDTTTDPPSPPRSPACPLAPPAWGSLSGCAEGVRPPRETSS